MAKAFIALGLEPRKSVGIIGFNSPEWFFADLAAIFANSMATGIYSTNSPEMCKYMANHSNANIIVVEDDSQLQKILKVKSELPGKILSKLVQTCPQLSELVHICLNLSVIVMTYHCCRG